MKVEVFIYFFRQHLRTCTRGNAATSEKSHRLGRSLNVALVVLVAAGDPGCSSIVCCVWSLGGLKYTQLSLCVVNLQRSCCASSVAVVNATQLRFF